VEQVAERAVVVDLTLATPEVLVVVAMAEQMEAEPQLMEALI
jgi:hypothetical protein